MVLSTIWKNMNGIIYARVQESLQVQVQKAFDEANLWFKLQKEVGRGCVNL